MRTPGDDSKLEGVTFGAVTSKSPSLLLIKTADGVFRVRITRDDLKSTGVKDLRDGIVGVVNSGLDLSKL